MTTKCPNCKNTHWIEILNDSIEWVKSCTNCGHDRKSIKRRPKGFYMTTAVSDWEYYYLTNKGWVATADTMGDNRDKYRLTYNRKTSNIKYWLDNPPYGTTVETVYTEL